MAALFYLFGVIFVMHEMVVLGNPNKYLDKIRASDDRKKLKKTEKSDSGLKDVKSFSDLTDEQKGMVRTALVGALYFFWTVIGILFASQWILFLILMVGGFFIGFLRRRFYKDSTRGSIFLIKVDALMSLAILSLLMINHFHHIF